MCNAATSGDLERRILVTSDDAGLTSISNAINSLLDSTDVYVRESTASLRAASDGRYFRRVLDRGMHGTFRAGAVLLNGALAEMKGQKQKLAESDENRNAMLADLESTLVTSANRISEAMQAISTITKNTHVLAINAKIEAARAGEAGRGFGIVAQNVEMTSHKVNEVMAEIEKSFTQFKTETHDVLRQVASRRAA